MLPSLQFKDDLFSVDEETALLARIDQEAWDTSLKRRVIHFGHAYKYRFGEAPAHVAPCPDWAVALLDACRAANLAIPEVPLEKLQIIVNEYEPGQGIAAHVDDPVRFDNWVVTVTLGSGCGMCFRERGGAGDVEVYLKRRSAYLMTNEARYNWTHEIAARKSDVVNGRRVPRERRVSVTFRSVV